ncbi:MAG: heavy metal translocating P-type ATPase [Haloferacaceae archaeon]
MSGAASEPVPRDDAAAPSDGCRHCGLALPDPPVTDDDVAGRFCCRGCLEVARALGDSRGERPAATDAVRDRSAGGDADGRPSGPEDAAEAFLSVDGMHCTACEAFLEGRAVAVDGVIDAEANYASDLLRIVHDGRTAAAAVADAVDGHGYDVGPVDAAGSDDDESVGRLLVGGFFGMMVMLWYVLFLYPTYLGVDQSAILFDVSGGAGRYLLANVWVMSGVVLCYTGYPVLRGASVSLRAGVPNMDLLVALAACSAYLYSTVVLLRGGTEVYFDVVIVVIMAVTVGNHYETRVKRSAVGHLRDLARERIETARVRTADGTERVPVDELDTDDAVVVREGESVPVDGTVVEGSATVDESLVTGESMPVEKARGDEVIGGSRVVTGGLVARVDGDSTLDRLVSQLWRIQTAGTGPGSLVDRLAAAFVPAVLALGVVAAGWRVLTGADPATAVLVGVTVLVVSCPCALGLATPLAVAKGVKTALDRGVVVTDGSVFERAGGIDVVALDKTGTLTTGEMTVARAVGEERALERAAAAEALVDHPVADAIARSVPSDATVDAVTRHRRGVSATVDGHRVLVGHPDLFADRGYAVPESVAELVDRTDGEGAVPALVGWDGTVRGGFVVADEPRPDWEDAVDRLAADARVVVLTGDDAAAAARFDDHPGVDEVFPRLPPEGKASAVRRLATGGTVAMVGDGINDAPALAAADLGVAVGGAAALATDAADVVVTADDLTAVPDALGAVAATRRRIRTNLAWAFLYNSVAVPAALAGVLTPLVAAVAMATSSLLVVGNSTRSL